MADTSDTTDSTDTSETTVTGETIVTTETSTLTGASPLDIDDAVFHADVDYLESLWRRIPVGAFDLPIIDVGQGAPVVFVPILEHLEFVYARQLRALSRSRRVILYRRREERHRFVGLAERAEELRRVLDALDLPQADLVGHGDGAMVLLEFAARYPHRCRSLVIIAQAADYRIAPHPFIWLLHELFMRLPVEHLLPPWFLRRIVINYIVSSRPGANKKINPDKLREDTLAPAGQMREFVPDRPVPRLPRHLIEEQFRKIALWPSVYKFSVLPIIHSFDMRSRLDSLTMPILIINRPGDTLSPEAKTRWLAERLPNCAGYYLVPGRERFFMYARANEVNRLIQMFYEST
jgi:pimeloyl-ACP methyl ester carboxylesterase